MIWWFFFSFRAEKFSGPGCLLKIITGFSPGTISWPVGGGQAQGCVSFSGF
jgi:hypothetical protein